MAIFKRKHLDLVLEGKKTQTRRVHKQLWTVGRTYGIRDRWFSKPVGRILILRRFRQRLGDISLEDVRKEGYPTPEEFKKAWIEIYGAGKPEQIVTAYEFRLDSKKGKPSTATENHRL